MKARIASELRRSNITTQIADAINSAVKACETERFNFDETRAISFSTVAQQEFYDADDSAYIPRIQKIDYVKLIVGDYPWTLEPDSPSCIETMNYNGTQFGQPKFYCYYGQQLRFGYIPADVYTVRIGGVVRMPAPASDGETDNPWMIEAERLVRCRAKLELAVHVLRDQQLAIDMAAATEEARVQMRSRTNDLQGGNKTVEATQW